MYMTLLAEIYPELALAETRSVRTRGDPALPDDEYAIFESYCLDPKCDCRRVMLNVASLRETERGNGGFLASIGYGFDSDDEFAGPELDPINPQSRYAKALLDLVEGVLTDRAYVARLKKHYRLAKKAASDPDPSIRDKVARMLAEEDDLLSGRKATGGDSGTRKRKPSQTVKSSSRVVPAERGESVPRAMRPVFDAVVAVTDAFCREHLNEEYAELSRKLAAALARKRPSPLAQGKPEVWACGIVYALGSVNFLWDKGQTPHMRADELCKRFGVSKSTGSARARSISDMFGTYQFDPHWCLPSLIDENPYVWMLSVNGVLVDIRYAPRGAQEEALRKGLIPYLPNPKRRVS